MTPRSGAALAGLALLLLPAGLASCRRAEEAGEEPQAVEFVAEEEITEPIGGEGIELFFPGPSGRLQPEVRERSGDGTLEERTEALLRELLAGPRTEDFTAALPGEVAVADVHLAAEGVAFVDLASPDAAPPIDGSRHEILAVYSLVNSILLNEPEIRAVVLLWNGEQRTTFAGHIDTSRPLAADPYWIRR